MLGAFLGGANLEGAKLSGADLVGAYLTGVTGINYPIVCPEEGSFVGFKKCVDDLIVKLEVTNDALRSSSTARECRCSKAKVLSITNVDGSPASVTSVASTFDNNFVYEVGKTVEVPDFDMNRWNGCGTGIHFFITRREAVDYAG